MTENIYRTTTSWKKWHVLEALDAIWIFRKGNLAYKDIDL